MIRVMGSYIFFLCEGLLTWGWNSIVLMKFSLRSGLFTMTIARSEHPIILKIVVITKLNLWMRINIIKLKPPMKIILGLTRLFIQP